MLDMQAWFVKSKMSNSEFPADRIVDKSYVDHAVGEARAVRAGEQGQHAPPAAADTVRRRQGGQEARYAASEV